MGHYKQGEAIFRMYMDTIENARATLYMYIVSDMLIAFINVILPRNLQTQY